MVRINKVCAPYVLSTDELKQIGGKSQKGNKLSKKIIRSISENSCLSRSDLIEIADAWNKNSKKNKNKKNLIKYTKKTSGKQLWHEINNRLKQQCNDEYCWINQNFAKDDKDVQSLHENFKTEMPNEWVTDNDMWLNTLDIDAALTPYERKYDNFEFIGPVPIDFDTRVENSQCVSNELCRINIPDMAKRGMSKLGVVFNLDKHTESGSHWVALYMSLPDNIICYWDSFAMPPPDEVVKLVDRLIKQSAKIGYKLKFKKNTIRHQYKNTECGVYCIHFIISLLEGDKFESVCKNIIPDAKMNEYRKIFFRTK